jgi:hypothetical protein
MLRCLEVEFLSLSASCFTISSICAAPFSNMCSTQTDNSSRKLRLPVSLVCPRPYIPEDSVLRNCCYENRNYRIHPCLTMVWNSRPHCQDALDYASLRLESHQAVTARWNCSRRHQSHLLQENAKNRRGRLQWENKERSAWSSQCCNLMEQRWWAV